MDAIQYRPLSPVPAVVAAPVAEAAEIVDGARA